MKYIIPCLLLALQLSAVDAWPSWANDWGLRIGITTDSSKIDSAATIPALFDLSQIGSGDAFWTDVDADGDDIVVGLGGTSVDTRVACHVLDFDKAAKTGYVVYAGSDNSTSTDVVYYIYASNATATPPAIDAAYGQEAVYSAAGCVVAHHFTGASVTDLDDYTASDVDFETDKNLPLYNIVGKHGYGYENAVGNEHLKSEPDPTPALPVISSDVCLMMWVYPSDVVGNEQIMGFQYDYSNGPSIRLSANKPQTRTENTALTSANGISINNWYQFAVTWDSTNLKFYVDGTEEGTVVKYGAMSPTTNATYKLLQVGSYGTHSEPYHGRVDTLMIFNVSGTPTAGFVSTVYNNQVDNNYYSNVSTSETSPLIGAGGAQDGFLSPVTFD